MAQNRLVTKMTEDANEELELYKARKVRCKLARVYDFGRQMLIKTTKGVSEVY